MELGEDAHSPNQGDPEENAAEKAAERSAIVISLLVWRVNGSREPGKWRKRKRDTILRPSA